MRFFFLLCFAVQISLAQNTEINPQFLSGNEPSLAINPKNNAQVMLAFNNNNVFRSKDTGNTFKRMKVKSKFGFYGDPVLFWDNYNNIHLLHLANNKKANWPESFDRIVYQPLKFNKRCSKKSVGIGFKEGKMQDKPWIFVEPKTGRVHVSWTQFDKYESKAPSDLSRIMHVYSDDNGKTFSKPTVLSHVQGNCLDGDSTLEGATIASDDKGVLYCMWSGMNSLWCCMSLDGGISWTVPEVFEAHVDGWDIKSAGMMRANGMPFTGRVGNKIFVCWAAQKNEMSVIYYKFYNPEYKTWEVSKTIESKDSYSYVMPHFQTHNNKVMMIFYGVKKGDGNSIANKINVFKCTIFDSEQVVLPTAVNDIDFISQGEPFLGDYIAISPLNLSKEEEALIAYTTLVNNRHTYVVVKRIKF